MNPGIKGARSSCRDGREREMGRLRVRLQRGARACPCTASRTSQIASRAFLGRLRVSRPCTYIPIYLRTRIIAHAQYSTRATQAPSGSAMRMSECVCPKAARRSLLANAPRERNDEASLARAGLRLVASIGYYIDAHDYQR